MAAVEWASSFLARNVELDGIQLGSIDNAAVDLYILDSARAEVPAAVTFDDVIVVPY